MLQIHNKLNEAGLQNKLNEAGLQSLLYKFIKNPFHPMSLASLTPCVPGCRRHAHRFFCADTGALNQTIPTSRVWDGKAPKSVNLLLSPVEHTFA